jgi:ketosteroid isomerase-like protein
MENEEIRKLVIAGYEKLRNGQFKELSEMYAEDAVWISPVVEGIPFSGPRKGREEILHRIEAMMSAQESKQLQITAIIVESNRSAVMGHSVWLVKATNKMYEADWVHAAEYDEDGRICRFQMIFDTAATSAAFRAS